MQIVYATIKWVPSVDCWIRMQLLNSVPSEHQWTELLKVERLIEAI